MIQLSSKQHEIIQSLLKRLSEISGVRSVVLGGSYARGFAQPESDIDLGILYFESSPFSICEVRELVTSVNDTPNPVVTGFYEWGPWVNGGAWLVIDGQRIDFIYRSLEHIDRVIADARSGRYELNYEQQPPFGFFSGTYLGEVEICISLFDPENLVDSLKKRVAVYPELLRKSIVQDYLWAAEFCLAAFANKYATRANSYGTAACLTRTVNYLVLALFAVNRKHLINDKTALLELENLERVPHEFGSRVQEIFGNLGSSSVELILGIDGITQLFNESVALSEGLYQSRYSLSI
jgi:predicted nucleotidyltransferase